MLASYDRQLAFGDLVADLDWELDQNLGELRLGPDIALPAQLLGSLAYGSTWRWAWANSSVDERLTAMAREAARVGQERGIAVLTEPDVDPARIGDPHLIGLAVAGLLGADAYYRCPYDGGEAIVLVEFPQIRQEPPKPIALRAMTVITAALHALPVPITKAAIANYLHQLGLPVVESADQIQIEGASPMSFRFDELGRLIEIKGSVAPDHAG